MTTTITTATFKKLRDGSWGIQGHGLVAGNTVTVTKRSGETTTGTVGRVLFTAADGFQIATFTARTAARPARRTNRWGEIECAECGDFVKPGTVCWETGCKH